MTEPAPTVVPQRRHLGWGAFTVAGSQVGMLVAAMVSSVVVARVEGPQGTGEFALVYALVDVTVMVAGLGLTQGITYAVSHRLWSLKAGFRVSAAAALVLGGAGAVVAFLAWAIGRDSFLEGMTVPMALFAAGVIPCALVSSFASTLALACERYEVYSGVQVGQAMLGTVLIVVLVFPFGMNGAIAGFSLGYLVTAIAALWWAWRFSRRTVTSGGTGNPSRASLRATLSFGLQAWSGNLLQYLNYRFDLFILNAYATRADVGVYSLAVSLTALGWVLPNGLQAVLFPRTASVAASAAAGEVPPDEANETITRASRHGVILMIPTAIVLILLLIFGIPLLYGEKFQRSVALGLILLPGVLAIGFGKVLTAATTGRGYPKYALRTVAIVTPITIALYFVLVPAIGATGAAISSTVSYVLTTILSVVYLRHVTGIGLPALTMPRAADFRDYLQALHMIRRLR